uniref:Uncharacterized protein n=1 Tax=Amphimedon queenslandica TaxID=400682 RepID=A0A1X7V2E2_AMPQE
MTQPHHHVFNVLQGEINRHVSLPPLLESLEREGIAPEHLLDKFKRRDGMKYMTGYLRSRDYDTFVKFMQCICETSDKTMSIVESVRDIVKGFDEKNGTDHAKRIIEILERQKKDAPLIESTSLIEGVSGLSLEDPRQMEIGDAVGNLPQLPYLEEPEAFTFSQSNSFSYRTYEKKYGLIIECEKPEECTVNIGICSHGPFVMSDNYRLATCFLCITSCSPLNVPLKITMEHCLVMSEYKKCSSVLILHADHRVMSKSDCFTFSDVFDFGGGKKGKIFPDISSTHPSLSFSLQNFCILCAAAEVHEDTLTSSSHDRSTDTIEQVSTQRDATTSRDLNVARQASSTESNGQVSKESDLHCSEVERSSSLSSHNDPIIAKQPSLDSSVEVYEEVATAVTSSPRRQARKRKCSSQINEHTKRSNTVDIEYEILLFEPTPTAAKYSVYTFVCHNCRTSIEECLRQVRGFYKDSAITPSSCVEGTFPTKELNFIVSNIVNGSVLPKKEPTVILKDELVNAKQPKFRAELSMFPPRIEYQCGLDHCMTLNPLQFKITTHDFSKESVSTL